MTEIFKLNMSQTKQKMFGSNQITKPLRIKPKWKTNKYNWCHTNTSYQTSSDNNTKLDIITIINMNTDEQAVNTDASVIINLNTICRRIHSTSVSSACSEPRDWSSCLDRVTPFGYCYGHSCRVLKPYPTCAFSSRCYSSSMPSSGCRSVSFFTVAVPLLTELSISVLYLLWRWFILQWYNDLISRFYRDLMITFLSNHAASACGGQRLWFDPLIRNVERSREILESKPLYHLSIYNY